MKERDPNFAKFIRSSREADATLKRLREKGKPKPEPTQDELDQMAEKIGQKARLLGC